MRLLAGAMLLDGLAWLIAEHSFASGDDVHQEMVNVPMDTGVICALALLQSGHVPEFEGVCLPCRTGDKHDT
jgi:hypothetical protein